MKRKAGDLEDVSHSEDESDQDSEDGPQVVPQRDICVRGRESARKVILINPKRRPPVGDCRCRF